MEKSSFFNAHLENGVYDRTYQAEDFAKYFSTFIGNGVFPNPSTNCQVTANDNMTIKLQPGLAWINGYLYQNTDELQLTVDPADGVLNRQDRVVLRLDFVNREIKAYVLKGEYTSSDTPHAPELTRTADIYELGLAQIDVMAGVTKITQSAINDVRWQVYQCGIVSGTVKTVDITTLYNQYKTKFEEDENNFATKANSTYTDFNKRLNDSYLEFTNNFNTWFDNNTTEWSDEFTSWFDGIKKKLSDDIATSLQNQIDILNESVNHKLTKDIVKEYSGEGITSNDTSEGFIRNLKLEGNTKYRRADKTYTDIWESGVSLESVGEAEKNSEGKYPINIESDGGKNLYVGTKDFSSQNLWTSYSFWSKETEKYKDLTVMSYSLEWNGMGQYKSVHIGETYTLSAYVKADSATKVCFFDNNHGVPYSNKNNTGFSVGTEWQRIGVSFTIIKDGTTYFRFENINKVKLYLCGVKLEKGLKNKVPEWNDELSLVDKRTVLLDSPLRKVGTIADVLDLEKMKVTRNCKTAIFDGSSDENWTYAGNNIFALPFTGYKKVDLTTNSLLMCDKFTVTSHNVLNNISGNYIAFESSYTSDNYLRIRKPDATDLATFTTWLQSNPVTVVYQLATPITENIDVSSNTLTDFATGCTLTIDNTIKGNIECNEIVGLIPSVEENGTRLTNVEKSLDNKAEKTHNHKIADVTGLQDKLDEVFQSVSNGKTLLETAITDKGSSVSKVGNVATFEELKTGIAGIIGTGLCELNIFTQTEEPSTKDGIWLKTSNTYDNIVNISDVEYIQMADIPYRFFDGSAVAIGNNIYLLGSHSNDYQKNNYKYNTTTNTYTKMTDIPYGFYYGSAVAIGNDIYLLGGYNSRTNNYKYNTNTNIYTIMNDIPYEFRYGSAVAIGNYIYLLGGYKSETINYKYNTTTDGYIQRTSIPFDFRNNPVVFTDNSIYILGGNNKNNYRHIITYKNSILFLYNNIPFKYNTKIFNTSYEWLNYISFDSVIMTDENCNNLNVETYIGNGTSWNKI